MSICDQAPFRADHVGSLLRPADLLKAREEFHAGKLDKTQLKVIEDEAIKQAVALQEGTGLKVVTDGEFRRGTFHGDFLSKIEGLEFRQVFTPGGDGSKASKAPFVAFTTDKLLLPKGGIEVEGFKYLNSISTGIAKVTIPSPTMAHFRGGREAISKDAYPDMEGFFADLAAVYQHEIRLLGEAGCRYLHLDDTNLAYMCDPKMRKEAEGRGENIDQLLLTYATLINDSISTRAEDMGVCIHLCRGNAKSAWFAQGGYEPVAEVLFNEVKVDGFFLEYDDERSGGFEPLRFVPKGTKVVLGLISSKLGALESRESIIQRIEEASRFVELDQLCLSPQCGFASVEEGNNITEDDQKRKLELVVSIAEEVWGSG